MPGRVAHVALGPDPQRPQARFVDAPVLMRGTPAGWTALVGLPLGTPPGPAVVALAGPVPRSVPLVVADWPDAEQRLRVAPRTVALSPEDLARHRREQQHQRGLMARRTEPWPASLRLQLPVPGRQSGRFGLRRVFNGQPRAPHGGRDIAAPAGTPVRAPGAARLADTSHHFLTGQSVWLDHGGGLVSLPCHRSRTDGSAGETVRAGQVLGAVGATGRATGPHLHGSVVLNRALVDPALFLAVDG